MSPLIIEILHKDSFLRNRVNSRTLSDKTTFIRTHPSLNPPPPFEFLAQQKRDRRLELNNEGHFNDHDLALLFLYWNNKNDAVDNFAVKSRLCVTKANNQLIETVNPTRIL